MADGRCEMPGCRSRYAGLRIALGTWNLGPGREGYTLLELLLSLCIVAVLVTLALPGFGRVLAERRATDAAHEVQRALRTAQQLATAHAGRFRRVEARFSYGEGPRVEMWGTPWEEQPPVLLGSVTLGHACVRVSRSGAQEFAVGFAASGSPVVGAHGTLEVRCAEAVRYVVVASVTGRIRVSQTPP